MEHGFRRLVDLSKSGNLIGAVELESQIVAMMQSGEAWLGMLPAVVKELWQKGVENIRISRPVEGTFPMITTVNVTKRAKDPKLAMAFVNCVSAKHGRRSLRQIAYTLRQ